MKNKIETLIKQALQVLSYPEIDFNVEQKLLIQKYLLKLK